MPKQMRLNALDMNCVGGTPGLWLHPEDQTVHYNTLDYWTDLAKLLERGLFDSLFIADIFGIYDVYFARPDKIHKIHHHGKYFRRMRIISANHRHRGRLFYFKRVLPRRAGSLLPAMRNACLSQAAIIRSLRRSSRISATMLNGLGATLAASSFTRY